MAGAQVLGLAARLAGSAVKVVCSRNSVRKGYCRHSHLAKRQGLRFDLWAALPAEIAAARNFALAGQSAQDIPSMDSRMMDSFGHRRVPMTDARQTDWDVVEPFAAAKLARFGDLEPSLR